MLSFNACFGATNLYDDAHSFGLGGEGKHLENREAKQMRVRRPQSHWIQVTLDQRQTNALCPWHQRNLNMEYIAKWLEKKPMSSYRHTWDSCLFVHSLFQQWSSEPYMVLRPLYIIDRLCAFLRDRHKWSSEPLYAILNSTRHKILLLVSRT